MKTFDVIGFGALNVDRIGTVPRVVRDGEAFVEQEARSPGGSAANTIWMLAQFGFRTSFIGAVGNDADGTLLLNSFQKMNVNTHSIVQKAKASGLAIDLTDPKGNRALYVFPGANSHLTLADLPKTVSAKCLHLSSFVGQRQLRLQTEFVKANPNCFLSFAPGMLYAELGLTHLKPLLKKTNVLFLNQAELKRLTHRKQADGVGLLLSLGVQMVVVTLGKRGTLLVTPTYKHWFPAKVVKVVDTTGAGDALAAGVLYGLIKKWQINQAVELGNLVASYCIQQLGARVKLPNALELKKQIQYP